MPSSRGFPWPRGQTCISRNSCTAGGFLTIELPGKPAHPSSGEKFISSTPKGCGNISQGSQPMDSSLRWSWWWIWLICLVSWYSCLLQVFPLNFSEYFHPFRSSSLQSQPHSLQTSSGKDPALTSLSSSSCEHVSRASFQVSSLWLRFSQWHSQQGPTCPVSKPDSRNLGTSCDLGLLETRDSPHEREQSALHRVLAKSTLYLLC